MKVLNEQLSKDDTGFTKKEILKFGKEKEKLQRSAAHSHGGLHHAISDKPIEHGPGQPKKPMFKPAARREPTRRLVHPDDRD